MSVSSASGTGSPWNSQITVRSLSSQVKGQALVDAPDVAIGGQQAMPALAVRVVRQPVEEGDALHLLDVVVLQREVILRRVVLDEELQHAEAAPRPSSRTTVGGIRPQPRASLTT